MKNDRVLRLMQMSIPLVKSILNFHPRRTLVELLEVGACNPDTDKEKYAFIKPEFLDVYGNK